MVPFLGPLRRYRIFLLVAIPILLVIFATRSSSSSPRYENVRTGGLGTNTWHDDDWADDHLIGDALAPKPNKVKDWMRWTSKGAKTILVTGGAGSLGHALIDRLVKLNYIVHAADIVPHPATLPPSVIYHRVDVTGSSVQELLSHTDFSGIVHFAAISLEQWCAPKPEECEHVNVEGTRTVMSAIEEMIDASRGRRSHFFGMSRKREVPWIIYGSSMSVYGAAEEDTKDTVDESTGTLPMTALGKSKLQGEDAVRDVFATARRENDADLELAAHQGTTKVANDEGSQLRAAILRFSDVYGYPRKTNVPAAFIPRLLQHAISSLPIQFSSDDPPIDLLHVSEAVDATIRVVDRLFQHAHNDDEPSLETFNIVKGGKRWMARDIVNLARVTLDSQSPVRDIGDKKADDRLVNVKYSNTFARDTLDWNPTTDFPIGFNMMSSELGQEVADYTQSFLNAHCPERSTGDLLVEAPEDVRNNNLYRLHNCTVNLHFNHDGWMHHLKCEDGKNCFADDKRVASYNWNATVWNVHVLDKTPKSNGRSTVRFRQENGHGWLGLREDDVAKGGEVKWALYQDNDPVPHIDKFVVDVAPDNSVLRVIIPGKTAQQVKAVSDGAQTRFMLEPLERLTESVYDMRMTMLCCQSEADWPLLLDDHESADIHFGREGQIAFNASRRMHLCNRAYDSHKYFTALVDKLAQAEGAPSQFRPKKTTQKPDNWSLKELAPCWNDCDSPTICIQTGNCRCVQADNCPRRRENPLIAIGRGIHPAGTGKNTASPLGTLGGYDKVLAKMVERTDWRDILLPEARDYLQAHPDFIKVHVVDGYPKQKEIEAADCHKLQQSHCFSADSIMYKAMRHLSVPADEAQLVVLPVYQHCTGADFILHDVWHYASQTIKGINEQTKPVSLMMTHDWGICLAFTWEVWESREKNDEGKPRLYPDPIMKDALVFSVMGDWDSNCYRPSQDVVVPARTCRSPQLVERFPDVESIQPVRSRPQLINWSGTFWGTGKSERLRLTCHRGGVADKELVKGKGPQSVFYDWADYMTNLNSARFCPQPRGVAGWSPRVNDAIFAGCIPVLMAEGSHYPFASLLDWSQFSVRIHPTEFDQIERILNDIPMERVEQMQANLVAVRQAFLYASDEAPEDELHRRGPMFFALHAAGMRLRTQYPDRHA